MAFSITPAVLFSTAVLSAGNTTAYTAPSTTNTNTICQKAVVSNPTAAAATITIYRVPTGSSAGAGFVLLPATSVAAGATLIVNELNNLVLTPGDSIIVSPSAAATLNFTLSGVTTVNS